MDRFHELLVSLKLVSQNEINEAIFLDPDSGIVESLYAAIGDERGRVVLEKVSNVLQIPLLAEDEIKLDGSLLEGLDREQLEALVLSHKAIPLRRIDSNLAQSIILAVSNPFDDAGIKAFTQLLGSPVQVQLAREKRILEAFEAISKPPGEE